MPKIRDEANGQEPTPRWRSPCGAVELWHGDALPTLKAMPAKSVQCAVTSPPYWGLRDYQTAEWIGGNKNCQHDWGRKNAGHRSTVVHKEGYASPFRGTATDGSPYLEQGKMSSMICLNGCGARRTDAQIGSESKPVI